jgi:signal peptidase I
MSSPGKIAWWGLQTIMWVVLLGFLLLLAVSRFTPYEALIVRSGSMEPTISTGGIVIVDRDARTPVVGAIASFRDPDGGVVTHRVVGIDDTGFVTRGDANRANDGATRPVAAVYGTVSLYVPFVGYVIHVLRQPAAFLVLLFGTGGFLIADALRTIARELARMRRDRRGLDAE